MKQRVGLLVALGLLVLCACDFSKKLDYPLRQIPKSDYEPTALFDDWTIYRVMTESDGVVLITPAELLNDRYLFSLNKASAATLSVLDSLNPKLPLTTYSWYDMTEQSFGAVVADGSSTYNCSYILHDNDHLELSMAGADVVLPGCYALYPEEHTTTFQLLRGIHPKLTFGEGATPDQLAENEILAPSASNPVSGSVWRFVSVGMLLESGAEERISARAAGVIMELGFNTAGEVSATIAESFGLSDAATFGYTYNPVEGTINFNPNRFFAEGDYRVVRMGDRLRLIFSEDDGAMVVYRFEQIG